MGFEKVSAVFIVQTEPLIGHTYFKFVLSVNAQLCLSHAHDNPVSGFRELYGVAHQVYEDLLNPCFVSLVLILLKFALFEDDTDVLNSRVCFEQINDGFHYLVNQRDSFNLWQKLTLFEQTLVEVGLQLVEEEARSIQNRFGLCSFRSWRFFPHIIADLNDAAEGSKHFVAKA